MNRVRELPESVDLLVVGGGISGAGVALEAARTGASVLLVEAQDFAAGTSSRSSKLVHGGLRYLKTGQWRLTRESVQERQRLLQQGQGLIEPLRFAMPLYAGHKPGRRTMQLGLWLYDCMAGSALDLRSQTIDAAQAGLLARGLRAEGLDGALIYLDAQTDDARLVWRVLDQARRDGARIRNYVALKCLRKENGRVVGAELQDRVTDREHSLRAKMVITTAGVWATQLAGDEAGPNLRPLRGSHFLFPWWRFPLGSAISWLHPRDRRPVFAYPWQGATIYGTTDVDHRLADAFEPRMTADEAEYLIEGLDWAFPGLGLGAADALSTIAGVRPVVDTGKVDPSAESRESAVWSSPGLVAMTGGKLTTFRRSARELLRAAAAQQPALAPAPPRPLFDPADEQLPPRLRARLGAAAAEYLASASAADRRVLAAGHCERGELRHAAAQEQVEHLDDLMLRRTRLGLLLPNGGAAMLDEILSDCAAALGWDAARAAQERQRYLSIWAAQHAPH